MLCGLTSATCVDFCGDRPGLCGLQRVTWGADGDLAAVLLWDVDESRGQLWTNRHLIHGALGEIVWRWAIHRVFTGKPVDVLTRADLLALPSELLAAAI